VGAGALITMCIGGGQGIALAIERIWRLSSERGALPLALPGVFLKRRRG